MVCNREGTRGRTAFMAQTAQSHRGRTTLTPFKLRIRSEPSSISHPLLCTEPPEVMAPSRLIAVPRFRYPSLHPPENTTYSSEIGSRKTTTWVLQFFQQFSVIKCIESLMAMLVLPCLQDLKGILDSGGDLPFPDGLLINGRGSDSFTFTVDQGNKR